jgi:hypothetical protein
VPSYEPEVIERFAAQLERRARAVRRGFTACGLLLGALFGSFPLTSFGSAWPIPHIFGFTTLLVGAGVGALIGWVVGEGRAAMYRLHAQTTLCQLHAQRTTLAIWRLLQERPEYQGASEMTQTLESEVEVDSELVREVEVESERVSEVEVEIEKDVEPEPKPALALAAQLAAPPAPRAVPDEVEPAPVAEPVHVRPPAPAPLPLYAPTIAPALAPTPPPADEPLPEPIVPLSAPPPAPAYEPLPTHEPAPSFAGHATPSALRSARTPVPPVQPPPLSS